MCIRGTRSDNDSCFLASEVGTGHIRCDSTHKDAEIVMGTRLSSWTHWRGGLAFGG